MVWCVWGCVGVGVCVWGGVWGGGGGGGRGAGRGAQIAEEEREGRLWAGLGEGGPEGCFGSRKERGD